MAKEWKFDKWYKKVFLIYAIVGGFIMLLLLGIIGKIIVILLTLTLWLGFRSKEKHLETNFWIANKVWKKFWIVWGSLVILFVILLSIVVMQWGSALLRSMA